MTKKGLQELIESCLYWDDDAGGSIIDADDLFAKLCNLDALELEKDWEPIPIEDITFIGHHEGGFNVDLAKWSEYLQVGGDLMGVRK